MTIEWSRKAAMSSREEIMAMEVSSHEGRSVSDMYRWSGPTGEVVYVFNDGTRSKVYVFPERTSRKAESK